MREAWENGFAKGRDRNYRGQRTVFDARPDRGSRREGYDTLRRSVGQLHPGPVGGPQRGFSGPAWARPQAAALGAEFSRQYLRYEAAWRGTHCFGLGGGL